MDKYEVFVLEIMLSTYKSWIIFKFASSFVQRLDRFYG